MRKEGLENLARIRYTENKRSRGKQRIISIAKNNNRKKRRCGEPFPERILIDRKKQK